jgi:hypothetical protein
VPKHVEGYVIFSQVAIDMGAEYGLGIEQQTALNLAMVEAIRNSALKSYDVGIGLPSSASEPTVYVRPADVEAWLKVIGYPLDWTGLGSKAWGNTKPGKGTDRRWTNERIEAVIQLEVQLKAQGYRDYARRAAEKFNIDPSRVRKLKAEYRERKAKLSDVSLWRNPDQ